MWLSPGVPTSYWFEGYCPETDSNFIASGSVLMYEDAFGEWFYLVYDSHLREYVSFMVL